jgi:PGF-CTERM protein
MRPERYLAGGAAVVVAVAVLLAGLVPGIVATPEEDVRPSRVGVVETTVAAGEMGGSTATLRVDSRLYHRGGPAENLSVHYRAVDLDTGLVATTEVVDVGTVEGEREVSVPANVTVERQGGYRLTTIVYEDGRRVMEESTEVRGVGTLRPDYATADIQFESFDGAAAEFPAVEYRIASVDETRNRTTLNVSAYLTNEGDDPEGDVRLVVQARQVDSNIVADRATTQVAEIRPGRTATPSVSLTVPSRYNYYLDATLWRDGVVVGTARAPASLDPTETVPTNTTTRDSGLRVGDFDEDDGRERPDDEPRETATASGGQPGFGPLVALAALGGGLLLTRRWSA